MRIITPVVPHACHAHIHHCCRGQQVSGMSVAIIRPLIICSRHALRGVGQFVSRASPTLQESMCIQGVGGSMDTSCTQILRNCVGWQDRLHQATHITPPDVSRLCELGFVMTAARACKAPTSICTTLSCCFPAIYACRAKTWTGSLLAGGCSCTKVPHSGA